MAPLLVSTLVSVVLLNNFIGICCIIDVSVDCNGTSTKFRHFWKSTGLCPPAPRENIHSFFASNDELMNLALIGSLPNNGIRQVRIHWLLNLISLQENSTTFAYNFTQLDGLINFLNKYNLRPGFELMGYPIGVNISNPILKTSHYWADLVHKIATRYIEKYGPENVSKWRFETWNEPDLKVYNILNFTLADYFRYAYGCANGLKTAFHASGSDLNAKLGGPAGLFKDKGRHPLCWGLLEACNSLPKSQCPLQYISFHRKGDASSQTVLNGTVALLDLIRNQFPNLGRLPIANDEADMLKTWSRSLEWRADVRYATMVVQVISGYYKSVGLNRKLKIEVLSNDNGFLNYHPFYFTQRTLLARFQMNGTHPPHNQFVRKPLYIVMGLLSLLGNEFLPAQYNDRHLSVLATRSKTLHQSSYISILLAYGNDTMEQTHHTQTINISLYNLRNGDDADKKFAVYSLDNIHSNPYKLWKQSGSPVFPSKQLRQNLRQAEGPYYVEKPKRFEGTTLNIALKATIPSVFFMMICWKPLQSPAKVTNVAVVNITGNEVLITWKHTLKRNRCIVNYEVEQSAKCSDSSQFKRVNSDDTIFQSYHHSPTDAENCENTLGKYRIRAVDYWNRPGEYSNVVIYA